MKLDKHVFTITYRPVGVFGHQLFMHVAALNKLTATLAARDMLAALNAWEDNDYILEHVERGQAPYPTRVMLKTSYARKAQP